MAYSLRREKGAIICRAHLEECLAKGVYREFRGLKTLKHLWLVMPLMLGSMPLQAQNQEANIVCPGRTTYEMQYCAGKNRDQSEQLLRHKLPSSYVNQWNQTTRKLCAKTFATYKQGSIYTQLVVGCIDRLNRALLSEFQRMGN